MLLFLKNQVLPHKNNGFMKYNYNIKFIVDKIRRTNYNKDVKKI